MGVENFFEVNCAAHTPEGTRFEMEGGQALWASNSADLPQHSLATLAVRPECVRLTHYPPAREWRPAEFAGRRTGGVDLRGRKTPLGGACFQRPARGGAGLERLARIAARRRSKSLCLVGCSAELGLSARRHRAALTRLRAIEHKIRMLTAGWRTHSGTPTRGFERRGFSPAAALWPSAVRLVDG